MVPTPTYTAVILDSAANQKRYDLICKKILASKEVLAYLFQQLLPEYADCSREDIKTLYIEPEPVVKPGSVGPNLTGAREYIEGNATENTVLHEAVVKFDVIFSAVLPGTSGKNTKMIVNVEAQGNYRPGYPIVSRGIYYACRLVSSQLEDLSRQSDYSTLQKVYSVWICLGDRIPKHEQFSISRYFMKHEDFCGNAYDRYYEYDFIHIVVIRMGTGTAEHGIFGMLQALFSPGIPLEEQKRILSDEYDIKMEKEFDQEVIEMCTLSQAVLDYGVRMGVEQGIEQGIGICKVLFQTQSVVETAKTFDMPQQKIREIAEKYGLEFKD